jgi:O-antigen ligase
MAQQRLPFLSSRSLNFSLAAIDTTLIICLVLSLGQVLLIALNPLFGLIGMAAIALIMLFLMRSELALPLYILVAAPTIVLSVSSSGILSRLYIGDLLFALIVGIWLLREISSENKTRLVKRETRILVPLVCLVIIGFISIIYSHLSPDPNVTYAFVHSDAPLLLVNTVEMFLLVSLPLRIIIVPAMVCSLRDARRMVGAYLLVGLPYALGAIFAGPLHLYSQQVILGAQRPEVFGTSSSNLGMLNVLFACFALGQMLYARKESTRLGLGLLTCIYAAGAIMSFGRQSWIALLLAIWVILWFRFKNPLALLVPLVILPFLFLFFPNILDFFDPTKVYGADRIIIWQDAIAIWQHSPFLGVGAGNFQFFDIAYGTDIAGVAHNQFLSVLAEMGVQGLVCLVLVIIMIGRVALERFNTAASNTGKAVALAYLGYFAAQLFATFFADSFVSSTAAAGGTGALVVGSYIWFFLGLVLSIPNWDREAAISDLPVQEGQ